MILCFIILIGMTALLCLSAGISLPEEITPAKGQSAFYKAAYYLLKLAGRRGGRGKGCEASGARASAFETERLARVLLVFFLGSGTGILLRAALAGQSALQDGYELTRPTDGQDAKVWELQAQIGEDAQTEQLEVVVSKRRYTEEEKQELLEQAIQEIDQVILGDNTSADEVRGRVVLPASAADGQVSVQWLQEPLDLLDADGNITEELPEEERFCN